MSSRCASCRSRRPSATATRALQVTYGRRDAKKLTKPEAGHFAKAGVEPGKRLVELRLDSVDGYEVGQEITVDGVAAGAEVDVTGVSRGKGFAGTMKRHNFKGQGASHGNHKHHRAPGSIGSASYPGRVFKGLKTRPGYEAEPIEPGARWCLWLPWLAPWPLKLWRFMVPAKPLPRLTAVTSTWLPAATASTVISWPTS